MIELARHIEILLLENDCVIVPGLGGFVAHHVPARLVPEENLFLPPTRIIGFNPQLKINDGVLVQSYMATYGTSFPDATKMVEHRVKDLLAILHEEGKANLPNVGELRYSIHETYEFVPYDDKVVTPAFYGMESFAIEELAVSPTPCASSPSVQPSSDVPARHGHRNVRRKRAYLSNAVAMVAAVLLFFLLSMPVENTGVVKENYALLMPEELFGKIEKQSLAITPLALNGMQDKKDRNKDKDQNVKEQSKQVSTSSKSDTPAAAKEVKANQEKPSETTARTVAPATVATPRYHIIVASVGTAKDAEAMAARLVKDGFEGAQALIGGGKMRVSIQSFDTQEAAYRALKQIRQNKAYESAWVLKQ